MGGNRQRPIRLVKVEVGSYTRHERFSTVKGYGSPHPDYEAQVELGINGTTQSMVGFGQNVGGAIIDSICSNIEICLGVELNGEEIMQQHKITYQDFRTNYDQTTYNFVGSVNQEIMRGATQVFIYVYGNKLARKISQEGVLFPQIQELVISDIPPETGKEGIASIMGIAPTGISHGLEAEIMRGSVAHDPNQGHRYMIKNDRYPIPAKIHHIWNLLRFREGGRIERRADSIGTNYARFIPGNG